MDPYYNIAQILFLIYLSHDRFAKTLVRSGSSMDHWQDVGTAEGEIGRGD